MRILYLCRIFSGFEESLARGVWAPTGAPTIYKLMNALAASPHATRFIMTARGIGAEYRSGWSAMTDVEVSIDGFPEPILVVAGENRFARFLGRWRGRVAEVLRIQRVWREVRCFRPDMIYVDRSNVVVGAILARCTDIPVFLRVMGVYPSMRRLLKSRRPPEAIQRWAFRAPFAHVLCTEDGTGGMRWMDQALAPDVPRSMMLNGVTPSSAAANKDPRLDRIPRDRLVFMFVGRLEEIKGCREFVDAFIAVHDELRDRIHAVIIGTGSLERELHDRVAAAEASEMVTFIPRLAHDQIVHAHRHADIYVSLNHLGNLSNANLECMAAGMCMIIPAARRTEDIDITTDELLPAGAAVRLDPNKMADDLASWIHQFAEEPGLAARYREAMRCAAAGFIRSWDERIADEFALLERVMVAHRP